MATKAIPETVQLVAPNGAQVSVSPDKAERLLRDSSWSKVAGKRNTAASDVFEPGDNSVKDVVAYLETADETERTRVLDAETAGKARVGITGWAPAPTE